MSSLAGQVAVVTGASRGIGAAIARRLAGDGAAVVVHYSTKQAAAQTVAATIEGAGGIAHPLQADLRDLTQLRRVFAESMARFGRLDILVNNAGIGEYAPLAEITPEHFDAIYQVNVRAVLFATQEAARCFKPGSGRIVNIGSGAAQAAPPASSVYAAAKSAVETMTRVHAAELGPRGITVNTVAPGLTDTDMLRSLFAAETIAKLVERTPLRRLGTPDDVADVVAFLVSREADWITGQVIGVSGGLR